MRARTLFFMAGFGILLIALLFGMAPGRLAMHIPSGRQGVQPNATFDVSIINFAFQPASLTIHVGDTVTWTNNGASNHTTTSNTLVWDSGVLTPGQSFSFTFTQTGVFPYHCNIHASMTGTITVIDLTTPLPTNTPTATRTQTNTPTITHTPTQTDTPTSTVEPSVTPTGTITPPTPTDTPTPTVEPSATPTGTITPPTPTLTAMPGTERSIYLPLVVKAP